MADTKLSALTALAGADVDTATDLLYIDDVSVTTGKKILVNELGIALSLYKSGTFTRDVSAASGSVAYTGIGFKPKAVIFFAAINAGTGGFSAGFSDATTGGSISQAGNASEWQSGAGNAINCVFAAGGYAQATIASFDADGFTLAWVKTASPTGTLTVVYLALR